jgi:hypothetical protein
VKIAIRQRQIDLRPVARRRLESGDDRVGDEINSLLQWRRNQ